MLTLKKLYAMFDLVKPYSRKEVKSMKKALTNKDIDEGKSISALFSTLSEENKIMAVVYLSALNDKQIADSERNKEMHGART